MAQWIEPQRIDVSPALRAAVPVPGYLGDVLAALLVQRGIADVDAAQGFLDPDVYAPAPPSELLDLEKVVERLARAIELGEQIAIWGDFDVDGQTATALYLQSLADLGARVSFSIPTRRQSHGMQAGGVQRLIEQGVGLILTADTGVDAYAAIDLAVERGVEVLVTDHHDLPSALPRAAALVNPKRLPGEHPLAELPGVGVAYQVMRALYERLGRGQGDHLLDLVALGIVADVATLRADVRYLLQRGLAALRQTERLGLQAVMDLARIDPSFVTEDDIRFALAPRLNAISRVGQDREERSAAADGVELLTTEDPVRARTIAVNLEALNARRRWLTRETMDAALSQLNRDRSLEQGPAIVVAGESWDPGIVGIVAGQLASRFGKPAVVFSAAAGEMARGSARSVEGIDIHAAIAAQKEMLYRCGGHPMAAGLSLESERIGEFRRALWNTLAEMAPVPTEPAVQIDAYLSLDQLSVERVRAVQQLSPFGSGNEAPVFATKGLEVVSSAVIGRTREHRRLRVRDGQGRQESVLWWRSADQPVPQGAFDLAYTIGLNRFRGQENVQLDWVGARTAEPEPEIAVAKPAMRVRDLRQTTNKAARLRALVAERAKGRSLALWGEGVRVAGIPLEDRNHLERAEILAIWTTPPGPGALRRALEAVSPQEVVLLAVDPGTDKPRTFAERLAGLVNYAMRRRDGGAELRVLATAMAHDVWTVRTGLEWMEERGQVGVTFEHGGRVRFWPGTQAEGDRLQIIEGRLQAQLAETAAYRRFFARADAERLIND